jgi:hypothetical protein
MTIAQQFAEMKRQRTRERELAKECAKLRRQIAAVDLKLQMNPPKYLYLQISDKFGAIESECDWTHSTARIPGVKSHRYVLASEMKKLRAKLKLKAK